MSCESITFPDGTTGIICSRGRRRAPCQIVNCGRPYEKLCDYPVRRNGKPGTCDIKLCAAHAKQVAAVADDTDYCPAHANLAFGSQDS
jgi:hypothetical protein